MDEKTVRNLCKIVIDDCDKTFQKAMEEDWAPINSEDPRQDIWLLNMLHNCVIHIFLSGKGTRYLINEVLDAIETAIDIETEHLDDDD